MYYTDREVRQLLEEAFEKGYDNGIDDTLDYIDENYELENEFDLMDEYAVYSEVTSQEDKKKAKGLAASIKQDEGESDEEFKNRKTNVIRGAIATMARRRNNSLGSEMYKLKDSMKTEKGKEAAQKDLINHIKQLVGWINLKIDMLVKLGKIMIAEI